MLVQAVPRPSFIPQPRLRGAKRSGVLYEARVGKYLKGLFGPHVHSGQWFKYGGRFCQPDHYVVLREAVLVLECKLSENPQAWVQLEQLYGPVLQAHLGLPVVLIQVCRHLRHTQNPITDLRDAKLGAQNLWHLLV